MDKMTKVAVDAAKEAAEVLLREYDRFSRADIRLKGERDIFTKADLLSEEIILKKINKNFSGHGVVSEERGASKGNGEFCWFVDPLDGTTNFSIHNPLWSISIALAQRSEIVLGVIYAPILNELYVASSGRGAELNGRRIKVSEINQIKIINTYGHGSGMTNMKRAIKYYSRQKLASLDCRQLGSAALELAYVASGRVESFVSPGANDWDVAAGVILVREAGGKITDFKGRPWQLSKGEIAASNGKIHRQILKVVNI